MPAVRKGEKRNSYVSRAVPQMMSEGLTQKQAVGKAEGMFDSARKGGGSQMAKTSKMPKGSWTGNTQSYSKQPKAPKMPMKGMPPKGMMPKGKGKMGM